MEGDIWYPNVVPQSENFNPLPPHGGRHSLCSGRSPMDHFNPLPPHGGRHCQRYFVGTLRSFQSTPSAWRETYAGIAKAINATISIHSLRMEGDCQRNFACIVIDQFQSTPSAWRETRFRFRRNINGLYFNPLPPHGGRRAVNTCCTGIDTISIHSLRMEGDVCLGRRTWGVVISIHSLRMEGDMLRRLYPNPFLYFNPLPPHGGRPFTTQNNGHDTVFQSTPSAWRETYRYYALEVIFYISIHSLRMEGDPLLACRSFQCIPISIHSLRMEGDYFSARSVGIVKSFQSTPSAWRETTLRSRKSVHVGISIHSLRMEGDTHKELLSIGFYKISIHSLRMEGDWRSASS